MGKCASYKKFITITLDKDIVNVMDNVIEAVNKNKSEKDVKLTRSQFIQDVLCGFMSDVNKINKQKGENNNA